MWSLWVVVRGIYREHPAQMALAEDQHPVCELGPDGQYEAFGETVRARTPWWDLDHVEARVREHRVKRGPELSGAVADHESEPHDVFAEVHH